jgi:microcystin-dependent protein
VQTALTNLGYAVNPVGTIIMSPLSDIQTTSSNKYLLCDGQSVGRSSYPNLFSKLGTSFGSADPFSFNVPNYQAAFLRGYGQAMVNGQIYEGNYTTNTPQQDAIQEHRHWGQAGSYCGTNRVSGVTNAFASGGFFPGTYNFDQTGIQSSGRSDSGETRPMNYSVFYYIKS